jgi:hypothetical protein
MRSGASQPPFLAQRCSGFGFFCAAPCGPPFGLADAGGLEGELGDEALGLEGLEGELIGELGDDGLDGLDGELGLEGLEGELGDEGGVVAAIGGCPFVRKSYQRGERGSKAAGLRTRCARPASPPAPSPARSSPGVCRR